MNEVPETCCSSESSTENNLEGSKLEGKTFEALIHSLRSRYATGVGDGIAWARAFVEEPGLRKLLGKELRPYVRFLFTSEEEEGSKLTEAIKGLRPGRAITLRSVDDDLGGFEVSEHGANEKPSARKLRCWFIDISDLSEVFPIAQCCLLR
jgi:hypothetical protein